MSHARRKGKHVPSEPRPLTWSDLTPQAKLDAARNQIFEGLERFIEAKLELGAGTVEWVDQHSSPLGRRRHCKLARSGVLPSHKHGRRWLVRRSDLDTYLASHGTPTPDEATVANVLERILTR